MTLSVSSVLKNFTLVRFKFVTWSNLSPGYHKGSSVGVKSPTKWERKTNKSISQNNFVFCHLLCYIQILLWSNKTTFCENGYPQENENMPGMSQH